MAAILAFTSTLCFAQNAPGSTILTDKVQNGAIVDEVTADGPAAKAGISAHDVITDVEGTALQSLNQIAKALARHKPGDTMELTVARASDGAVTEVTMTLGANPGDASRAYMGLTLTGYMFFLVRPEDGTPPARRQAPPGI